MLEIDKNLKKPSRFFLLLAGLIAIIVGCVVISGWHFYYVKLIFNHPKELFPILYKTALTFIFLGVGCVAFVFNFKLFARICAVLAFLISFYNLLEYMFGIDLGIQLYEQDDDYLKRMAPNTAICIALTSAALWLISTPKRVLHKAFYISILLSVSLAISAVAFSGYLTNIETAYRWGSFSQMALHTSLLLILLNLALWLHIDSLAQRNHKQFILWYPIHLAIGVTTITICLWQALLAQDKMNLLKLSKTESTHVQFALEEKFNHLQRSLAQLAQRLMNNEIASEIQWDQEVNEYLSSQPGSINIHYLDSNLAEKEQVETSSLSTTLRSLLTQKVGNLPLAVQKPFGGLTIYNKELVLWHPLFDNKFRGLIVERFNIQSLFDSIFYRILNGDYSIEIYIDQQKIYNYSLSSKPESDFSVKSFNLLDSKWDLNIWPSPLLIKKEKTNIPLIAFLLGLFIAALSSLTSYLFHINQIRRKELEQTLDRLSTSTKRNQILLNFMGEGMISLTPDGVVDFVNESALKLLGYEETKELIGTKLHSVLKFPAISTQFESTFERKNGTIFPVEYSSTPIGEKDKPTGYIIVFRDITNRRETEKEFDRAQNLFKSVIDNANTVIYVKDLSFSFLIVNKNFLETLNVTNEEVIGKNDYDLFSKATADKLRKNDQKIFLKKEALYVEEIIPDPAGNRIFVTVKFPIFDQHGKIYALGGISTDITDRKRTEYELKTYLEKAEVANQELEKVNEELRLSRRTVDYTNEVKNFFLSNVSHEIRTLLSTITGLASLLLKMNLNPKEHNYLSRIHLSGKLLNELVNDILDLSKIGFGKYKLDNKPTNLVELVKEISDLLYISAEEKGLEMSLRFAPPFLPIVIVDSFRIRQILFNLISNAIKFTDKGHIFINVICQHHNEQEARFRFEIADTGTGIPLNKQTDLFEELPPLNVSNKTSIESHFGLTLSKQLVELMKGEIGFVSEEEKGSTFWFELPLKIDLEGTKQIIHFEENQKSHREHSVLIVDDLAVNRYLLEEYMTAWNIKSYSCASSEEALNHLKDTEQRNETFDFAILDYQIDGLNGVELAQKIKLNPYYKQMKLILLTSIQLSGQINIEELSNFVILTKPIDPIELFKLMFDDMKK